MPCLGAEVPGHHQEQPTQTLIVRCRKLTSLFKILPGPPWRPSMTPYNMAYIHWQSSLWEPWSWCDRSTWSRRSTLGGRWWWARTPRAWRPLAGESVQRWSGRGPTWGCRNSWGWIWARGWRRWWWICSHTTGPLSSWLFDQLLSWKSDIQIMSLILIGPWHTRVGFWQNV